MDRRTFAQFSLLGVGLAASAPASARAADTPENTNLLFTESETGHWGVAVAAKHVPQVVLADGAVRATTPHPQSDTHFIVSHTVVLGHGVFLGRMTFTPRDAPVSEFKLPEGYKGPVTVTSTCNLHDIWAQTVTA